MAKRLAILTLNHKVLGSNPVGGQILSEPKRCFIEHNLSCSRFSGPDRTEMLLKGMQNPQLNHPSCFRTTPTVICRESMPHCSCPLGERNSTSFSSTSQAMCCRNHWRKTLVNVVLYNIIHFLVTFNNGFIYS